MTTATATWDVGTPKTVRAPRGTQRTCKTWQAEAAMRMLMNNLDPEVAEKPEQLIIYGGSGEPPRRRRIDFRFLLGYDSQEGL